MILLDLIGCRERCLCLGWCSWCCSEVSVDSSVSEERPALEPYLWWLAAVIWSQFLGCMAAFVILVAVIFLGYFCICWFFGYFVGSRSNVALLIISV